jgi:4,5-dihydroxyphthalate decarboxylase
MAWFREPMARQREALGEDPWCDGVEKNRHALETLIGYLHEQGMIKERPRVEDIFALAPTHHARVSALPTSPARI